MPTGSITFTTLANSPAVGSSFATYRKMLPKSALTLGENILAVEVHQQAATSSDKYFDLSLDPVKNDSVLVASPSAWKYNDQGVAQTSQWVDASFDDSNWNSGNGVFGYGNGDETTVVSYGNDITNKHITTYFRKKFDLISSAGYNTLKLLLKRDDAAVVYVNGVDVYRNNLVAGPISFTTTAINYVEGADENNWITINLPTTYLVSGENVIAVEVHKFNATESDLRFDMQVMLQQNTTTQTAAFPTITCDPSQSQAIGCFTSVKPSAQTQGFVIPPTHTFQLIAKQGMSNFYSNSTRSMPSNHDFTGYVASNGSSKQGVVSVNHENDPGDVSLISTHFNDANKLWVVDSARLVDFSQLVRTSRNCSGGVTPWGTVVTSEETYTTADANADGYQDRGWQVEINPVTGKVVDYNGDNLPDKIWAMGRMNHENIAISKDSAIAFQAEDGGTSGVYKYVMNQKGNLSAGTLYVLKRDNSTSTSGTWVVVPNTTQAERNTVASAITALGGTNWNGPEDIEFGPDGKMYFTSKGTGTIWRFKDDGLTVSELEAWVTNTNYAITHSEGTVNESFGTGIDNLAFDGEGNLWANQDGGRGHLWVIRPDHTPTSPKVELFSVTPAGSESTGLTFTPDFKYGFMSIQHPTANGTVVDAAGNNVVFNAGATIVFARKEFLGAGALEPIVELGDSIKACVSTVLQGNLNADVLNVWRGLSTTPTVTVTQTGWYKLTTYSNNGKMAEDSVHVTIYQNPNAPAASNQAVCIGNSNPNIVATGTSIKWYNDAALSNLVVSSATLTPSESAVGVYNYYATQTSINGCVSSPVAISFSINNLPASPSVASSTVCQGATIPNLLATGTNIKWYDDSSLNNLVSSLNSLSTGQTLAGEYTYYATQTDGNGCVSSSSSASLTIYAKPIAPALTNQTICFGLTNPSFTTSANAVIWYSDASLTNQIASGNAYTSSETNAGIYTYYATQTSTNNCQSNAAQVTLEIYQVPLAPISSNKTACTGQVIPNLTVTGSNVKWYTDAALLNQVSTNTVFATGQTAAGNYTYFVTQTNANNCVSQATSVVLSINATPNTPVISGNLAYCEGDVIGNLSATGSNIKWYNNSTLTNFYANGNDITPMSSTAVYYAISTVNNCTSQTASVTVVINALPVVSISGLNNSYFVSDNAVTLSGTPSGGLFSGTGISGNTFNPSTAGVGGPYTISYSYTNTTTGCANTTTASVTVNLNVGMITFDNGSQVSVFPNPATDIINVNIMLNTNDKLFAKLYDISGKEIELLNNPNAISGNHLISVDKAKLNLAAGTYWLKIGIAEQQSVLKLIFQ
jgi:secreted PhoX family phosphatase